MTTEQLQWIPCNKITPNRYQPRTEFKSKELEELAESIDQQGLIQPITVRRTDDLPDGCEYELIAGERRWRATSEILGKEKIRAIVKVMTDEASQEAAITENLQREDLNVIEEAKAILQLMELNSLTQEQVAKRLGKSRSYIANTIRLVRLNKDVVNLVSTGAIDRSKATALMAVTNEAEQTRLAKMLVSKSWTVEKLRSEIEKFVAAENAQPEKKLVRRDVNGQSVIVATPSKGHRRKMKSNTVSGHFVLVELDSDDTVKDFVKYMSEQEWKCWVGEDAVKQLDNMKAPVEVKEESLEDALSEDPLEDSE